VVRLRERPYGYAVETQDRQKGSSVADLTVMEEKLAEVLGLAQAAQVAIDKVVGMVDDDDASAVLKRMRDESEETERRCTDAADQREGKKTAILDKASETKSEGAEMMKIYLSEDSDELDGFEFLTMTEAGEVGHWAILGKLNEAAGEEGLKELVDWALPLQEEHLKKVRETSLELAAEEDPYSEE
jgi:hypothetical protein